MPDVILYTVLHDRARDVPCAKGPVRAVPHTGAGYSSHYLEGHGLVNPDYEAVRECLPHYWRKAWDRRSGAWFAREDGAPEPRKPAHVTLRSARGKTLATIYLQPYRFKA